MIALSAAGVRKTFAAESAPVRALRDVEVVVEHGEFVALMGPSGCGKSTLLNVFAGFERPDEGTVLVDGEEITGRDENWLATFRRHHIGVAPRSPDATTSTCGTWRPRRTS